MKCVKTLGLLAVAAAALMAFAGTASATVITSPSGTTYTSTVKAESEGPISLDGAFTKVSCNNSTIEGKIETHGAAVTAGGKISSLTFTECNFPSTVKAAGSLEVHGLGNSNGTVTSSGASIEITTSVGTCVFTTSGTDIGTLTGSSTTNANSTLDMNSAKIPRTGGNFLCGSSATATGSYKVTTPSTGYVD